MPQPVPEVEDYILLGVDDEGTVLHPEKLILQTDHRTLTQQRLKKTLTGLLHFSRVQNTPKRRVCRDEMHRLVRCHKQQGNSEQAHEYLTKALEIFERLGTLIEPDKVRKQLADVT